MDAKKTLTKESLAIDDFLDVSAIEEMSSFDR